jgi:hypothetical protein
MVMLSRGPSPPKLSQLEPRKEIEANILDLMMRYGLSEISFRGSNCDSFGGDGPLDNITILPYNPMSMETESLIIGNFSI